MKQQTSLLLVPIVAVASIMFPATPSSAGLITIANRRFTGSACVQVGTGGVLKITGDDGSVYNDMPSTGSSLVVDCPVLQNEGAVANPPAASDLWYLDNSTSSITCTYKAEDQLTTVVNQQTASSTGDDNGYRKLTFNVSSFGHGITHIRCSIPPRDASGNASYVVGYAGW